MSEWKQIGSTAAIDAHINELHNGDTSTIMYKTTTPNGRKMLSMGTDTGSGIWDRYMRLDLDRGEVLHVSSYSLSDGNRKALAI